MGGFCWCGRGGYHCECISEQYRDDACWWTCQCGKKNHRINCEFCGAPTPESYLIERFGHDDDPPRKPTSDDIAYDARVRADHDRTIDARQEAERDQYEEKNERRRKNGPKED